MSTPDSAPGLEDAAKSPPAQRSAEPVFSDADPVTADPPSTGAASAAPATSATSATVPDQRTPVDTAGPPQQSPSVPHRDTLGDRVVDAWWRLQDRVLDPSPGLIFALLAIAISVYLCWGLVLHPNAKDLKGNAYDQYYFEWQFSAVQHALFHFENPFFSHGMNAPAGVNMVANPQILGPAAVLSPVTWLFGPYVSFMLITVGNLAATAITWRWFLRKCVVETETAAYIGGLFFGFAPSMMSHSLAHPNLAGQWLVPLIVERVLRLRTGGRPWPDGLVLGLLIAAQVFVGEELLFLTALGLGLFVLSAILMAPRRVWDGSLDFLRGSAMAVGTAGAVLAYPLSFQFFGRQAFKGIPFSIGWYSADLKSYAVWPNQELWGDPAKPVDELAPGNTEQAALLGWVLLLVVVLLALWCLRLAAARALVLTAGVLLVLSLGPTPVYDHDPLPSPWGPSGVWNVIGDWPLFSSALPIRTALAISWIVGVLLALGIDKAMRSRHYWLRGMVLGGVVAALVPLLPRPFEVEDRPAVPRFFTTGMWKQQCLPHGHTIVGSPLSDGGDRTNLTWATAAGAGFDIPQGPAMTPQSATDKQVVFGRKNELWTAQWMSYIYDHGGGSTPAPSPAIRAQVAADLKKWDAGCVVVADTNPRLPDLQYFLNGALAPGVEMGGVWVWKAPAS